jgi:hypothetical protein
MFGIVLLAGIWGDAWFGQWLGRVNWIKVRRFAYWDLSAILVMLVYFVLFYCDGFFRKDEDKAYFRHLKMAPIGLVVLLMAITVALLVIAFTLALAGEYIWELVALIVSVLFFGAIDRVVSRSHRKPVVKTKFGHALRYVDVPMAVAFLVLLIYLLVNPLANPAALQQLGDQQPIFFSGAIAFQILAFNTTFAILFAR